MTAHLAPADPPPRHRPPHRPSPRPRAAAPTRADGDPGTLVRLLTGLLIALVALGAAACSSAGSQPAPDAAPTTAIETTVPETAGPDATTGPARVVRPDGTVRPVAAPGSDEVVAELAPTTELGSDRALLVVGEQDGWLEVLLPVRPNGTTGWLPVDGLEVRQVDLALEVDLAGRTLTLTEGDQVVLTSPVAVGAAGTPTPTGRFAVTDKLATPDPGSAYGPFAIGLSGHSDVLTEFAGGDGQIGIHGTDDPSSIGLAVSHGCVRVPNDVIATLSEVLPLGTPVTVR